MQKFEILAPGIRVTDNENFNLLGDPILESGFRNFSKVIMEKFSLLFDRLKNLPAHSAYFLMEMESILKIRMDNKVWIQATHPTSYGRLGASEA